MSAPQVRDRRRVRQLASDKRSGRYARLRYREAYRGFIRRNWQWLLSGAGLFLGLTGVLAALVRGDLLRGIVIGFGLAATVGALSHLVVLLSGVAPTMMGEVAEQWTTRELQSLIARGWRLVNHLSLSNEDIDHVLVGSAGVMAIETKWSADWGGARGRDEVDAATGRVVKSAMRLAQWHPYKSAGLPAPRPLVVLWGHGAEERADAAKNPAVIAGEHLGEQIEGEGLVAAALTVEQMDRVWDVLVARTEVRDAWEAEHQPVPDSIQALGLTLIAGLLGGLVSFIASAKIMTVDVALWAQVLIIAAIGLAASPARRWRRFRPGVTGWQAGVVAALAFVAAAAGEQILR